MEGSFPPYLYACPPLPRAPRVTAGVAMTFRAPVLAAALADAAAASQSQPLTEKELEACVNIVIALATEMPARRDFDVFVPTARGTLVPAEKCVFNNMEWLPQEEQELTRGEFDLVHPKLSQAVSHACGCLGLSFLATSSAAEQDRWYEAAGQSEPLTVRLKNLLKDYPADATVFKELVQNADDEWFVRVLRG